MEDSESIINEGSRPVRDTMDPAVHLEEGVKVRDARQALENQKASYGVVRVGEGTSLVIVTQEQLSFAHEDALVQSLNLNLSHPEPVEPHETLDEIVRTRAGEFAKNPALTGIVVREQDHILGVLPRDKFEKFVSLYGNPAAAYTFMEGNYMGFPAGLLEGAPASGGMLFICNKCERGPDCPPDGPEKRYLSYFPGNPPKCKAYRHDMKYVEE